jgi:hypothetical protein
MEETSRPQEKRFETEQLTLSTYQAEAHLPSFERVLAPLQTAHLGRNKSVATANCLV